MRYSKLLICFLFSCSLTISAYATKSYWVGGAGDKKWTTATNWSTTSGSGSGGSVPGVNDTAYFDISGASGKRCNLDGNISVKRLEFKSTSNDTLDQNGKTITVATAFVQDGGLFLGSTTSFTDNGTFSLSGGVFKSTSGTLLVIGNFTSTGGTFTHNRGLLKFTTSNTITGSITVSRLEFNAVTSARTFTIAGGTILTVDSTLTFSGTTNSTLNTGTIYAHGDITDSNSGTSSTGGTATIVINGGVNQSCTGSTVSGEGRLPNIQINKGGGTLFLYNTISVAGNWTHTAGRLAAGTSLVFFYMQASGTLTVTGTDTLFNVAIGQVSITGNKTFVVASGDTLNISNDLYINCGSNNLSINTGIINVGRHITITNTGSSTGGTGTIFANGTGSQTLTGSGIAGSGRLCNFTINKSLGTLTLFDIISFDKAFVYTAGTVAGGASICAFYGTGTLDPENSSYSVPFCDVIIAASRTLSGKLTSLHDLSINSSQTLTSGGYDICVGRDWANSGTFSTSGSGYVKFDGSVAQTITKSSGSETFKKLWVNNSATSTVTLSSPVIVTDTFKLHEGKVVTTSTNLLTLNDNAGVLGGSDTAYVSGPMKKIGNEAINFPLGNTSLSSGAYHPLAITAPSSASDAFTSEYKLADPTSAYGTTLSDSVEAVSNCEYWTLTRNAGSSTVKPSLGWNSNMCLNNSISDLDVAYWAGAKWYSLGAASRTISGARGVVDGNLVAPITPAPLTFSKNKKVDYALLKRKLDGGYYSANSSKLRFKFDEEYNDGDQLLSFRIISTASNTVVLSDGSFTNPFKQVSFGDNRYGYDLSLNSLASGFYILEVTNEKSEKMYLRFKI